MVKARNLLFSEHDLTSYTHYIASTGIGTQTPAGTDVLFDAYSVKGLAEENVTYLHASSHMNRTSDYGVAFERGVALDFHDRRKIIISGTASIDAEGNVTHPDDVEAQCVRMTENVSALLAEAGAGWTDLAYALIYIRDISDADAVRNIMSEKLGEVPFLVILAPVCRPGWLVEMECMAIV